VEILEAVCTLLMTEGFGSFEIGQVIRTVKYSGEHALLAKGQTVLQGMIGRLKLEDAVEWK
jgi:hypothetical protein